MALNDIVPDDAGDAKGGRPPENRNTRDTHGDGYSPSKHDPEWWGEIFDQFVEDPDNPEYHEVMQMADYTHLFAYEVIELIEDIGVHQFRDEIINDDWVHNPHEDNAQTSGNENSGNSSDDEGGLMGLVN